jgi:hypothetical protein
MCVSPKIMMLNNPSATNLVSFNTQDDPISAQYLSASVTLPPLGKPIRPSYLVENNDQPK